jgi:hypothetical protein
LSPSGLVFTTSQHMRLCLASRFEGKMMLRLYKERYREWEIVKVGCVVESLDVVEERN